MIYSEWVREMKEKRVQQSYKKESAVLKNCDEWWWDELQKKLKKEKQSNMRKKKDKFKTNTKYKS